MGRSYTVPRKVSGETRIIVIFTIKSLISTIIFGVFSIILYNLVMKPLGAGLTGVIICFVITALGYAFGAITFPENVGIPILKRFEGDNLTELTWRYFRFKKKIYICTEMDGEKK